MKLDETAARGQGAGRALPRGRVVVRWIATENVDAETEYGWRALLDDAERARADRFHFASDRTAFTAAHALTRTMLTWFGGLPPQAWRFVPGVHGKPEIDPVLGHPGLRFNLSHTRGLVACAVAREDDVGLDVEAVDRSATGTAIAERFFTPDEIALITACPPDAQREVFFRLWTLKEAVMKTTGHGFHLALDAFAMSLSPLGVRFFRQVEDDPATWAFAQQLIPPRFVIAAALRPTRDAIFDMAALARTVSPTAGDVL